MDLLKVASNTSAVESKVFQQNAAACFKKATVLKSTVVGELPTQGSATNKDGCLLERAVQCLHPSALVSFLDLLQWDEHAICGGLTNQEICEGVTTNDQPEQKTEGKEEEPEALSSEAFRA